MSDSNQKLDLRGVWLALPAITFLLLYMAAAQFTLLDHLIAFVFVALLAYGTLSLQQQQKREQLQRLNVRQPRRRIDDEPR